MFRSAMAALLPALLFASAGAWAQPPLTQEAELQLVLAEVEHVISESESTPLAEDKAEWRARLNDVLRHWAEFRDARCDVRLIAYEQAVGEERGHRRQSGRDQAQQQVLASATKRKSPAMAGPFLSVRCLVS